MSISLFLFQSEREFIPLSAKVEIVFVSPKNLADFTRIAIPQSVTLSQFRFTLITNSYSKSAFSPTFIRKKQLTYLFDILSKESDTA